MGIFGLYERSHIKRYWINQMLYWLHVCICLRLLVWNAGRWHVKKKYHLQKVGGGGKRPPCPSPSAAYVSYFHCYREETNCWSTWLSDNMLNCKYHETKFMIMDSSRKLANTNSDISIKNLWQWSGEDQRILTSLLSHFRQTWSGVSVLINCVQK